MTGGSTLGAASGSRCVPALLAILALAWGAGTAAAQSDYPNIPVWSFTGAWHPGAGADTIENRARTLTVRWMRDPIAEARPGFAGYRIYRATSYGDTSNMLLMRRFSKQYNPPPFVGDSTFLWHFPPITTSTPESQRIATFIDPDSAGRFEKVCRLRNPPNDPNGACLSPRDSIILLVPPPGPHDGFRTWYSITYEARNTSAQDFEDQFIPGPFGARADLPSGSGAHDLLMVDANQDGVADLVVSNGGANTVSVFLGTGDGSFQAPKIFTVGTNPGGLTVSDFNGDGHIDFAVANRGSNDVSVLLGNGDGSFGRRADFAVGAGPVAVGAVNANEDSYDDLIVATTGEASCSLLLGRGDGTFSRGLDLAGATASPSDVVVSDLNGDGRGDLVVGTFQGAEYWRGRGDGTFNLFTTIGFGPGAHTVAVTELNNGDIRPEILCANASTGELQVGVDTSGTYQTFTVGHFGAGIAGITTADLDADGTPDVVMTNPAESRLAVVSIDTRTFTPRAEQDLALAGTPLGVATARLNQTGLFDIAIADSSLGTVSVILGPENLNTKSANVTNDVPHPRQESAYPDSHFFARAVEPTGGPTANLNTVGVVPNPYRASEAWNQAGQNEMHFINLPATARIRIFTLAGDLVRDLQHQDPIRDFERWDLKNGVGRDVASGIYMYRVEAENFTFQSRFIVIR